MVERVACTECGALILPTTAADTGGRCMPCVKGTRAGMDALKAYRQQEKQRENDGFHGLWESLVHRAHHTDAGFEGLAPDEQTYYALWNLVAGGFRGGLYSFFEECTGDRYLLVRTRLEELGKTYTGEILDQAEAVLFGNVGAIQPGNELLGPPFEYDDEHPDAPLPAWSEKLAALDQKFYEDRDQLWDFLEDFAREKGLLAPFALRSSE